MNQTHVDKLMDELYEIAKGDACDMRTDLMEVVGREGYSKVDLEAAFNLVKDPEDWKKPIDKVIDTYQMDIVGKAIQFFTATEPMFEPNKSGCVRVTSIGYRAGPAGDH